MKAPKDSSAPVYPRDSQKKTRCLLTSSLYRTHAPSLASLHTPLPGAALEL